MIRVLFVCTGNICRSPMAEAVFAHLVKTAGLDDQIEADSAATTDYEAGSPTDSRTLNVLNKKGITYTGYARVLEPADFEQFDYVVAMDNGHLSACKHYNRLYGSGRVHIARMLDYAPEQPQREVPDPYYDGQFDLVYTLVLAGSQGLLAHLRKEHNL
jgi:protein-tyrosine phosphatase